MLIKDINGKYELEINAQRGILFEKVIGFWKAEDIERYRQDCITKVVPALKGKKWAKCSDIREYKTSSITEELNKVIGECTQYGLVGGTIIVDSAIAKMQMSRSTKNIGVEPVAFDNLDEADKWLKSQGF